ncbi:surface adhesion protein Lsa23 [Leptospira wolffii]|uniref:Surface adhesion protein Lsa23 n=1 Tax=Leptospira wolffii TaxID=409998 RepID=A0ABV5BLW3_9LEPT
MKAFLLLLPLYILSCRSPELPVFPAQEGICPKTNFLLVSQPETDVKSGNELLAVYCKSEMIPQGSELQISLVFRDEIHPNSWKDFFYRIYRRFRYGRTYDIESFRLKLDPNGKPVSLELANVYSGDQIFLQDPVEHFDKTLSSSQMKEKNSIPILYSNTWNHMFGEKDNNPDLPKQELPIAGSRFGTRSQLDDYFGGK